MEFERPQTREEMLDTLNEIYQYYRLRKDPYSVPNLPTINLQGITYEKMTDEEIYQYAKELLKGEQDKEILERKESLERAISEKNSKIEIERANLESRRQKVVEEYDKKIKNLELDGEKNGLLKGSVIGKKKLELYSDRDEKLQELELQSEKTVSALLCEIASLNSLLEGVEEYFSSVHQSAVESKAAELKQKQFDFMVEVLKYNNSVQERNIKYANYLENTKANLELKYIEIRSEPFTKEQLIELGYYTDVIECIRLYHEPFDVNTAFREFEGCPQLVLYLEDFYDTVYTYYKIRTQ